MFPSASRKINSTCPIANPLSDSELEGEIEPLFANAFAPSAATAATAITATMDNWLFINL